MDILLSLQKKSAQIRAEFNIHIAQESNWQLNELDDLYGAIDLLAQVMGGRVNLARQIGETLIARSNTGGKLALAYKDRIEFSPRAPISAWSVIHEFAHIWDAKRNGELSIALEKFTGGFTDLNLSAAQKSNPTQWDAGANGAEKIPGRYGRMPGVNAYGYFYGDKPSGSNWRFNRKEDFAESLVMYCGWGRGNILSKVAHGRIERYLLPNGSKDPIYHIADNWSDYARYFYPAGGDYAKTIRWQFIHDLINDK
jgi:hypothetical protein